MTVCVRAKILLHMRSYCFYNTTLYMIKASLSHDVAVIQWITSCHKNRMTTGLVACAVLERTAGLEP